MLDARGGASGFNDSGNSDFEGGESSRGGGFKGGGGKSRDAAPKSFEKDLDDEIPF
jgi:hypothetical protein